MTAAPSLLCYRFGRFELQPNKRRLLASGAPVDVGSRAFDLLVMLVERDGYLVTKDELLERVWPKAIVEENTLQAQVSALRKILGPEAIATISGRGYRFALELTFAGTGARAYGPCRCIHCKLLQGWLGLSLPSPSDEASVVKEVPWLVWPRFDQLRHSDEAEFRCSIDRLGPSLGGQLPKDVFRMRLDCIGSDTQLARDHFVG
jgi:hypothetical protein